MLVRSSLTFRAGDWKLADGASVLGKHKYSFPLVPYDTDVDAVDGDGDVEMDAAEADEDGDVEMLLAESGARVAAVALSATVVRRVL